MVGFTHGIEHNLALEEHRSRSGINLMDRTEYSPEKCAEEGATEAGAKSAKVHPTYWTSFACIGGCVCGSEGNQRGGNVHPLTAEVKQQEAAYFSSSQPSREFSSIATLFQ